MTIVIVIWYILMKEQKVLSGIAGFDTPHRGQIKCGRDGIRKANQTDRMTTDFLGGLPLMLGEKVATISAVTDTICCSEFV